MHKIITKNERILEMQDRQRQPFKENKLKYPIAKKENCNLGTKNKEVHYHFEIH